MDTRLSAGNVDTLADFSVAQGDRIGLAGSVFGSLPSTTVIEMLNGVAVGRQMLKSSAFTIGMAATAWEQRIVYDQASGAIYFDADGFGGKAQVQFAKVAAGAALTAAHFQLFTL
jgi:Ca2+-binding RTX toxin-like protein